MASSKRIAEFQMAGFAADPPVEVMEVRGVEGVSLPFRFELQIGYLATLTPVVADILAKPAWLGLKMPSASGSGTITQKFHGVVSSFEMTGKSHEYFVCRVVLESLLFRSTLLRKTRMFTKTNVKDLLPVVLKEGDFTDDLIDASGLTKSYPERESITQENETNFDFCSRLMERHGIFTYFDLQNADKTPLVLSDDWTFFPPDPQDAHYRPASVSFQVPDDACWMEGLSALVYQENVIPDQVVLTDYDWRQTQHWRVAYPAGAAGKRIVHIPGEDFRSKEAGEAIAQLRYEELESRKVVVTGTSNLRRLRAGSIVTVKEWFHPELKKLRILKVEHELRQPTAVSLEQGELFYRNTFVANPADAPYRPPRKTPKPVAQPSYGFVDVGTNYAGPENSGLYPVRDPNYEDHAAKEKGKATRLFRRMHENAGPNGSGDNRPLHYETEVLKIPVGGDPDRQIIAGALFNSKYPDVVTGANAFQSIRKTAGGITEIMEDTDGAQYYSLFCPTNNDHISLGADHHSEHAPPGVAIGSKSGITINAGGGVQVTAGSPNHDNGVNTQSESASHVHSTAATVAAVAALACGIAADAAAGGVGAIAGIAGDVGGFIGGLALPGVYLTAPGKASLIGKAEAVVGSLGSADVIALGPANILSVTSTCIAGGLAAAVISGLNVEAVSVAGNVKIHAKLRNVYVDAFKDIKLESTMGNIILETKLNDIKLESTGAFHLETFTDRGVIHIWKDLEIASKDAKKIRLVAGGSEIILEDKKIQLKSDTIELVTNDKKQQYLMGKEADSKGFGFDLTSDAKGFRVTCKGSLFLFCQDGSSILRGKNQVVIEGDKLVEKKPSKIERANSEEG